MAFIYEASHFEIVAPERPHVARSDGGHVIINPKVPLEDRTQLTPVQAIELAKLTIVAGAAMRKVMTAHGVAIGRINYQDNGNWRAELHVHLYGRALDAKLQPYGHALRFPPTREAFLAEMGNLEPLTAADIEAMRDEIVRTLATETFRAFGVDSFSS